MAVSPTTVPVQWSTKKCDPICAPGCKSMPDRKCAHSVMMRGISATFFRYSSCASRCTAMASMNGYDTMISSLLAAAGSPSISRFHVRLQNLADARQAVEKFQRQILRRRRDVLFRQILRRMIFEALADFVLQLSQDQIQQRRRLHLDFGGMNQLLVKETGEQQPQQILRDGRDGALGGQVLAVQMIDAADLCVGRDQAVRELGDGFHGGKLPRRGADTKILSGPRTRRRPARAGIGRANNPVNGSKATANPIGNRDGRFRKTV